MASSIRRRKGSLAFSATVRYIRFSIAAGSPADGAAYWSIGSAWPFASLLSLPRDPLYGSTAIDWKNPQQRTDLPNGSSETFATGAPHAEVLLQFAGRETDDIEEIVRRARAGTCWFDFGLLNERGMQWPVTHNEDVVTTRLEGFNRRRMDVRLREIA